MNSQYVSYPPYYTYQSDSKKKNKLLRLFPFLSSRNSSETKSLIGFSVFVAFILLLAICGIIGLSFMGSFFRKVDRLKNSDFSIDVQDAFQIQNQQISDILKISQSNRTKVQKDAIEVEKIFIETKLGDHFKAKLNNNFKNIYNIRLSPDINNDIIDVSYTVKTRSMPKKTIKTFRNSLLKILSSENIYKNLLISQNSKIMNDNLNPIISDAIEGEIFGSLQSSSSKTSALRDSGDKKSTKKQITQEMLAPLILEKPTTIFPYDTYMDKIDYDRPFYELNSLPTYFEPYENRYQFSDENFYEKKQSNEKFSLEANSDKQSLLKPKPTTEKISIQKTTQPKSDTSKIEHKITTKSAVTSVTNVQKPNEVIVTPVFTTEKIKTLDEILQELIDETMLKNSDLTI